MKLRFLSGLILLTASAFPQQLPPGLKRFQAFKGMTKRQVLEAAKATKNPKLLYAEYYFVVPQIADGIQAGQGVWTSELHIVNLDPSNAADYELDFYNPDGSAASVGIVCPTGGAIGSTACTPGAVTEVSSIVSPTSTSLAAGQSISFVTGGQPATTQSYWGMLNIETSGPFVSVYETINLFNAASNYLASESGPSDFGIYDYANNPGTYLPFDNTNGGFTTAAFVNPDAQLPSADVAGVPTLQITFIDSTGAIFDTETYTVPAGTQTTVVISNQWPLTAGIAGTMYIVPYIPASGATAASYPVFSDITVLALQATYIQNGSGFSHSDAFVPLLTIGCYTGSGC